MKLELNLHSPLTEKQKRIIKTKKKHLLINGPAGTAKTYSALARGLLRVNHDEVDRVVIIRSPVEIREIGHLPGDADEKLDPYAAPYMGILSEISPKMNYRALVQKRVIEFVPTTFLRGTTFHNAYILVDEYQNMSAHELETIVTRIGEGTELSLCGDPNQSDLGPREKGQHHAVIDILTGMEDFEHVNFEIEDIVRSEFVKRYYIAKASAGAGSQLSAVLPSTQARFSAVA